MLTATPFAGCWHQNSQQLVLPLLIPVPTKLEPPTIHRKSPYSKKKELKFSTLSQFHQTLPPSGVKPPNKDCTSRSRLFKPQRPVCFHPMLRPWAIWE